MQGFITFDDFILVLHLLFFFLLFYKDFDVSLPRFFFFLFRDLQNSE